MKSLRERWDYMMTFTSSESRRKNQARKAREEIIPENFPNLAKDVKACRVRRLNMSQTG